MDFWEKTNGTFGILDIFTKQLCEKKIYVCMYIFAIREYLRHPSPSLLVLGLSWFLWCFSILVYYFNVTLCLEGQTFWSWKFNKICERWSFQNNIRRRRGEDDGYANQPMCPIFSRSKGRSDVIIVQGHMCVNFLCMWEGRGVRENSTLHLKLKSWTVNRWKSNVKNWKKFVKRPRTYHPKAERIQILGQIEPFAQKFQNL